MKFIETLFLGILIACTSLIAQVFVTVIAELFFRTVFTFQYLPTDSIHHICVLMIVAASTEEILRYLIIKKRVSQHTSSILQTLIHGFLLGSGFASFELFLASLNHTVSTSTISMFIPVFIIHIILSIFLLFFIKSTSKTIPDSLFLITSIILHTASNLSLFYFLT